MATNLANQNSIQEEIKRRLKSANASYHLLDNILSCSLLPKNIKIKIYSYMELQFCLLFCMGVKLGRSH
jgi:acyl-coenzyme A synthetase/AMP-(fatty) acid ligase